jgi:large subunit ribosomal protein L31e
MGKKEQRTGLTETAIDTTINIHKLAHKATFKKKAPTAVKKIKQLVSKMMRTSDVRIDPKLNQFVWGKGIRNLPHKVRVRISRKRNEEEGNTQGEFYSLVQHVHIEEFTGRLTEKSKVSA